MQNTDVLTHDEVQKLVPLRNEEEVCLVTRQHIIFFFIKTLLGVFSIVLLWIMGVVLAASPNVGVLSSVYWSLCYFLVSIIILTYTIQLHNYFLSKQILTNGRIIDYEQRGLFRAEVNETFLANVENINIVQKNIWNTIFNYGSVDVQTAGQKTELSTSGVVFEDVPDPKGLAKLLSSLAQEAHNRVSHEKTFGHKNNGKV